jgi:putative N-acetylmannosamine-6-phosphate epimerase
VQGYKQLPNKGERVIITSSLKDVICLHAAGYNAIAMQSEMQVPEQKLVDELKSRFKQIDVLYDNDFAKVNNPGQTMAKKICDLYGFNNICIPTSFESKDPSDLVSNTHAFTNLNFILND